MIEKNKASEYHTFSKLDDKNLELESLGMCEYDGSYAFQHDLNNGVHPLFKKAQAIYSEPAWRYGYMEFYKRSGTPCTKPYSEYLDSIRNIIRELKIPAFVLCGAAMKKRLGADHYVEIKLVEHNCVAYIAVYNTDMFLDLKTNHEFQAQIAKNFDYVLDFNCGYGHNIIEQCLKNGHHYLMSDLCGHAIHHIANKYMNYKL